MAGVEIGGGRWGGSLRLGCGEATWRGDRSTTPSRRARGGCPGRWAPSGIGESGGGRQERQPRTTARRPPRLSRPTVSMGDVTCTLARASLSFATCSHHRSAFASHGGIGSRQRQPWPRARHAGGMPPVRGDAAASPRRLCASQAAKEGKSAQRARWRRTRGDAGVRTGRMVGERK